MRAEGAEERNTMSGGKHRHCWHEYKCYLKKVYRECKFRWKVPKMIVLCCRCGKERDE